MAATSSTLQGRNAYMVSPSPPTSPIAGNNDSMSLLFDDASLGDIDVDGSFLADMWGENTTGEIFSGGLPDARRGNTIGSLQYVSDINSEDDTSSGDEQQTDVKRHSHVSGESTIVCWGGYRIAAVNEEVQRMEATDVDDMMLLDQEQVMDLIAAESSAGSQSAEHTTAPCRGRGKGKGLLIKPQSIKDEPSKNNARYSKVADATTEDAKRRRDASSDTNTPLGTKPKPALTTSLPPAKRTPVPFTEMQRLMETYGPIKSSRKRKGAEDNGQELKADSVKRKFYR